MTKKDAFTSSKTVHLLIALKIARVPQHPFPRSVDWTSGADSTAISFLGSYTPGLFSYGDSFKIECLYQLSLQMSLSSELELLPRVARYWLQVGRLTQWKSHRTITVRGKTRCVLLYYSISKHCTYPLNKFIYSFKVVKLFLKHPLFI
jgi:hypothetical protein